MLTDTSCLCLLLFWSSLRLKRSHGCKARKRPLQLGPVSDLGWSGLHLGLVCTILRAGLPLNSTDCTVILFLGQKNGISS